MRHYDSQQEGHPRQMSTNDSRRLAKQRWRASQREANRRLLPQPAEALGSLFEFLVDSLALGGCDHTFKHTRAWILKAGVDEGPLLSWLEDNGGFCDCEALANSKDAWADAIKIE